MGAKCCIKPWSFVVASLALLAGLIAPTGASAASEPTPWNGVNPFKCKIQNAGQGTQVPDPGADPYCVYFDKTNQNVSQLGLVNFFLKEPARTASAVPKCFYFQSDHWRGSLIQSDQQTVVYEFYGHYFFNKATGDGGVWVTDFTVGGQTFDPTSLPGFPPGYGNDFGPGTGGFITHNSVPADPSCAARAERDPGSIYASSGNVPRCVPAGGRVNRHGIEGVTLGTSESRLRGRLGPPGEVKRGFLHYCVAGGGQFLVGQPGDRSGTLGGGGSSPTVMLLTTARGFWVLVGRKRVVRVGSGMGAFQRAFPKPRRIIRLGNMTVVSEENLVVGLVRGRVVMLGVYRTSAIPTKTALAGYLERAR